MSGQISTSNVTLVKVVISQNASSPFWCVKSPVNMWPLVLTHTHTDFKLVYTCLFLTRARAGCRSGSLVLLRVVLFLFGHIHFLNVVLSLYLCQMWGRAAFCSASPTTPSLVSSVTGSHFLFIVVFPLSFHK